MSIINKEILINGVSFKGSINNELSLLRRIDERLDVGNFTIPDIAREELFVMLDNVIITLTDLDGVDKTFDYKIASDRRTLTTKAPKLYTHEITLIETTKKLDYFLCSTLTFTQPTDGTIRYYMSDVIDRINEVGLMRLESNLTTERVFIMDAELRAELSVIEAPQLFLTQPTIREAINEAAKYVNALCRLNTNGVLNFDFFNRLNNEILDIGNVDENVLEQDISLYGTNLESNVDNTISENNPHQASIVYPNENGFFSTRPVDGDNILTSSNAGIVLPFDVDFQTKLFTRINILSGVGNKTITLDITKYVVEEKIWRSLDNENPSSTAPVNLTQRNTIIYKKGTNLITGLSKAYGIFNDQPTIDNVIESALIDIGEQTTVNRPGGWTNNFDNFLFRSEYVPRFTGRFQIEKQDISDINKYSQINNNQLSRIVSLDAHLNNQYGKAQRNGNSSMEITRTVTKISELWNINDYYKDFILTEQELIVSDDEIIEKTRFDKGFNRLSEFTGLDAEVRQYEIPGENISLVRHLLYKDYIEFSTTSGNDKTGIITDLGRQTFMDTYTSNASLVASSGFIKPLITLDLIENKATAILKSDLDFTQVNYEGPDAVKERGSTESSTWPIIIADVYKTLPVEMRFKLIIHGQSKASTIIVKAGNFTDDDYVTWEQAIGENNADNDIVTGIISLNNVPVREDGTIFYKIELLLPPQSTDNKYTIFDVKFIPNLGSIGDTEISIDDAYSTDVRVMSIEKEIPSETDFITDVIILEIASDYVMSLNYRIFNTESTNRDVIIEVLNRNRSDARVAIFNISATPGTSQKTVSANVFGLSTGTSGNRIPIATKLIYSGNVSGTRLELLDYTIDNAAFQQEFNDEMLLGLSSNGAGNALTFSWEFFNNQVVGNQVVEESGDQKLVPIKYTDESGLMDRMIMKIVGELPWDEEFAAITGSPLNDVNAQAKKIPLYDQGIENVLFDSIENFIVKKDASEILKMTYQLDLIVKQKDINKIIIGRELTKNNALVSSINLGSLYLYASDDEGYSQFDNLKAKGVNIGKNNYIVSKANGFITLNSSQLNKKSWGLADDNGNLYLGVNQIDGLIVTIFHDFREKRSGIQYDW